METAIEENIYSFYDKVGGSLEIDFHKTPEISWMKGGNGYWPNMIYNTSIDENKLMDFVNQQLTAIKTKKAPPFWLIKKNETNFLLAEQLKGKGLREIFHWTGMGLDIDSPLPIKMESSITIKKVKNITQLRDWLSILSIALMDSKQIKESTFSTIYKESNIELYLAYVNDIPVSTGLSYLYNNHAGIYMISTLAEHRRKGIGTAITAYCINEALKKGINKSILQASRSGEPVYQKMGFKKYCEFSIYWMLGKEYL